MLDYLIYVKAIHKGLQIISNEYGDNKSLPLRGPAGLFKNEKKHPLCWGLLDYCQKNKNNLTSECPINILTYHRKGHGQNISKLIISTKRLYHQFYQKYPNLQYLPLSNE